MFDAIIPQYQKIAVASFPGPHSVVFLYGSFGYIRQSFPIPGSGIFSKNRLFLPGSG